MSASIYDVAQRAGVSIATVSRYLNGSAAVSEKKAQAVQEAMDFFQYEPNQFARGLMKQTTNLIGIYFPEWNGSIFDYAYNLELLKGIEKALSYQNYSVVLLDEATGFSKRKHKIPRYLEYVKQKRLDGLILSGLSDRQVKHEVFRQIMEEEFPVVYIGKRVHERGLNIYAQFEQYQTNLIRTLWQHGHCKILMFISRFHDNYLSEIAAQVRLQMPEVMLRTCILEPDEEYREQMMQSVTRNILDGDCTAAAIGTMEDTQLFLSVCAELHLSVPDQVSVISVEHKRGAGQLLFPKISSYFVPAQTIGGSAAELLMQSIRDEEIAEPAIEYEPVYVPRDSIRRL